MAAWLGMTEAAFRAAVDRGDLPQGRKFGKRHVWHVVQTNSAGRVSWFGVLHCSNGGLKKQLTDHALGGEAAPTRESRL